jgi:uncharacterized small protein (DUF1192 family)
MVQKSHDELASKKQTENELISRDLNMTAIKERDTRAKLLQTEKELGEVKDMLRATQ